MCDVPKEFIVITRKPGEVTEEKKAKLFQIFNETIDTFLSNIDYEEGE